MEQINPMWLELEVHRAAAPGGRKGHCSPQARNLIDQPFLHLPVTY